MPPLVSPHIKRKPNAGPLPEGYATTADISFEYGVSQEHVSRLIQRGEIEGQKLGPIWIVNLESWKKYNASLSELPHRKGARRGRRANTPK